MASPQTMSARRARRVALPRPPETAAPHPFPLLATIAPVFASIGLWALTSSPFALMFAAIGPVIAVASVGDARITAHRTRRRERQRFSRDTRFALEEIRAAHSEERRQLSLRAPGARGHHRRPVTRSRAVEGDA